MEGKEITEGNITRYCKPSKIRKKSRKPFPAAFELREGEHYLSAYLLEYFKSSCEKENVKAVKKYMEKVRHFSFRKNEGFAVLNIDQTRQYMINASQNVRFKEKKLPHCGILFYGDDLTISKLLAQCVHALYLVKDLENEE